jgi:hypothetical protein
VRICFPSWFGDPRFALNSFLQQPHYILSIVVQCICKIDMLFSLVFYNPISSVPRCAIALYHNSWSLSLPFDSTSVCVFFLESVSARGCRGQLLVAGASSYLLVVASASSWLLLEVGICSWLPWPAPGCRSQLRSARGCLGQLLAASWSRYLLVAVVASTAYPECDF